MRYTGSMAESRVGPETIAKVAAVWDVLIDRIRDGEIITTILREYQLARKDVYGFMRAKGADVRQQWDDARLDSADALFDRAIEISAKPTDKEFAQSHRTHIDTLKWASSVRNPRIYGNRADINVNVTKTVNLNAIIAAADARLAQARDVIEGEIVRKALPAELASIL